eukprot:1530295-Rhodomonas_salina.1
MPQQPGSAPSTPAPTNAFPSPSSSSGHVCQSGFPPLPRRAWRRQGCSAWASARLCTMRLDAQT